MEKIKFSKIILILILMFSYFGCATDSEEVIKRPSRSPVKHIYLESEEIFAYFEVTNISEYKKLIPSIFGMPEKPLCRVAVRDFYKMESGPPYIKSMIDILVKYKKSPNEKEISVWYCLEMPVTTEDALWGRFLYGDPKVLRKVTFERYENRYIGTSYGRDGKLPMLKLILEVRKVELTPDEKSFLDFVTPIQAVTIKDDKLFWWAGIKYKIYELEKIAPRNFKVKFGDCSIEYPNDSKNYLYRLGVSKFIVGYWSKFSGRSEGMLIRE